MIISHKYRYVFAEIPHTASHAIAEQLIKHYHGRPILRKHANITQFRGQATPEEKTFFAFATVRNPLDSATTDYEKLKNNHRDQFTNPTMLMKNGGHVTADHLQEFEYILNNQASFPDFFKKFRNKIYNNWFLIGDQHFDCVIRFESLQHGFSEVLRRLDIRQIEPVGHVNPTQGKRRSYAEYYPPDTRQQVARCYGPFMQKWRYDFPEDWGNLSVPRLSKLQFALLDRSAGAAARYFTLDPDNQVLHGIKKSVDMVSTRLSRFSGIVTR